MSPASPTPSRAYTVTGLTTGTTYHFRVAAKNDLGWSPHSNVVSGTPQLMVPWPPRSLTAWAYPDRVTLRWIVPSMDGGRPITAYLVQRSIDGGRTWVNVAGVPYPSRIYTVTGLTDRDDVPLPRRRQEHDRLEPRQQRRHRHARNSRCRGRRGR